MQKYQKILIKLSGEVLKGDKKDSLFDERAVLDIAKEIAELAKDHQVVLFMGGGNIFRWRENHLPFLDRVTGDWIGIKATILNGLVLSGALRNKYRCKVKMFTDHEVKKIYYHYNIKRATNFLRSGNILIISSWGTPHRTTDTGAAETAQDLHCNLILKGSKVKGVYSADPKTNKDAIFYPELSYKKAIDENLAIMDDQAFKICQENKIPIIIFNLEKYGNIKRAVEGEVGSIIR